MSTDEQRALWTAIRANPDDDTPRLVYADWLQEHEQEDRAEFIRVQIELHQIGRDRRKGRKRRPILEPREKALLAAHRYEWATEFLRVVNGPSPTSRDAVTVGQFDYRRGFVHVPYISVRLASLLAVADETLEPVQLATASDHGDEGEHGFHTFARWPGAAGLHSLTLRGRGDDAVRAIVAGDRLCRLVNLHLLNGSVSDDGVRELARWARTVSLRGLGLNGNPITDVGALALANSPYLDGLDSLVLWSTQITEDGRRALRDRFGRRVSLAPGD